MAERMPESSGVTVPVTIVQRVTPACFEAVWDYCASYQNRDYTFFDLDHDINNYYNNCNNFMEWKYLPNRGEAVAVCLPKDQNWYRGILMTTVETKRGYRVNVNLVDMNRKVRVPLDRVRKLHKKFSEFPPKGITLELLGLVPCSLEFNADTLLAELRPNENWATHAYTFVDSLLKRAEETLFTILGTVSSEKFLGIMYFKSHGKLKCLNDLLVNEHYAFRQEIDNDGGQIDTSNFQSGCGSKLVQEEEIQENITMAQDSNCDIATPEPDMESLIACLTQTVEPDSVSSSECSFKPGNVLDPELKENSVGGLSYMLHKGNEDPSSETPSMMAMDTCSNCKTIRYSSSGSLESTSILMNGGQVHCDAVSECTTDIAESNFQDRCESHSFSDSTSEPGNSVGLPKTFTGSRSNCFQIPSIELLKKFMPSLSSVVSSCDNNTQKVLNVPCSITESSASCAFSKEDTTQPENSIGVHTDSITNLTPSSSENANKPLENSTVDMCALASSPPKETISQPIGLGGNTTSLMTSPKASLRYNAEKKIPPPVSSIEHKESGVLAMEKDSRLLQSRNPTGTFCIPTSHSQSPFSSMAKTSTSPWFLSKNTNQPDKDDVNTDSLAKLSPTSLDVLSQPLANTKVLNSVLLSSPPKKTVSQLINDSGDITSSITSPKAPLSKPGNAGINTDSLAKISPSNCGMLNQPLADTTVLKSALLLLSPKETICQHIKNCGSTSPKVSLSKPCDGGGKFQPSVSSIEHEESCIIAMEEDSRLLQSRNSTSMFCVQSCAQRRLCTMTETSTFPRSLLKENSSHPGNSGVNTDLLGKLSSSSLDTLNQPLANSTVLKSVLPSSPPKETISHPINNSGNTTLLVNSPKPPLSKQCDVERKMQPSLSSIEHKESCILTMEKNSSLLQSENSTSTFCAQSSNAQHAVDTMADTSTIPLFLSKKTTSQPDNNSLNIDLLVKSSPSNLDMQPHPNETVTQPINNSEHTTSSVNSPVVQHVVHLSQTSNKRKALQSSVTSNNHAESNVLAMQEDIALKIKNPINALCAHNSHAYWSVGRGRVLKEIQNRIHSEIHQKQNTDSSENVTASVEISKKISVKGGAVKRSSMPYFSVARPANPNFSTRMDDPLGLDRKCLRKILVCGQNSPKPIRDVAKASFNNFIVRHLQSWEIEYPATIQAYVWPAVLRGRNVAVIGGPRSGKTFSYLLPLLSFILDDMMYNKVPAGNEPVAVIICAFWKSATKIYDECLKILKGCETVRVLLIHGGGYDESQWIKLMNGCDILISTPCAILRLLRSNGTKPTGLNRLCHLILDEMDVLTEEFTEELKELIKEYTAVLKKRNVQGIPCQIMAFGCKWTVGLQSFISNVMPNPLFYCSSFCESIIFAGINTVVHTFSQDVKADKLIELLKPNLSSNTKKIVICTSSSKAAEDLHHILSYACKFNNVHLATEDLSLSEVLRVGENWKAPHFEGQEPILIATDGCLDELNIEDAECLIHYDIPVLSKSSFGLRFSCLLKHMKKVSITERSHSESEASCITHIITTSDCVFQAHGLIQLLKRLSTNIPIPLLSLALGYYQGGEERKDPMPLCVNIKAFGQCSNQYWCTERHILLPGSDTPSSLICRGGHVVLHITDVRSATWYFARIIKYQKTDGFWEKVQPVFLTLNSDMATHFVKRSHRVPHLCPAVGDMCAIVDKDDGFYRVRVLEKPYVDPHFHVRLVNVLLVDLGSRRLVEVTDLLQLPGDLASYPSQAIEVFLCNLQPADKDYAWTNKACSLVDDLIYRQEVIGKVALCLGSVVWLKSVIKQTKLRLMGKYIPEFSLRQKLLDGQFAIDNPKHLPLLEHLTEEVFSLLPLMEIPDLVGDRATTDPETTLNMEFAFLPLEENETVHISCLSNPGRFFITKVSSRICLENLMNELEDYKQENPRPVRRVVSGMYCIAIFPNDGSFYRGRVLDIIPNNANPALGNDVRIFYVDYGDEAIVHVTDIYPLQHKYVWKLPFQAIECSLAGIVPMLESGWTAEASEFMWINAHDSEGYKKTLSIKALKKHSHISVGGGPHYEVEMHDTTDTTEISFADWLCAFSHAWVIEQQNEVESETGGNIPTGCDDVTNAEVTQGLGDLNDSTELNGVHLLCNSSPDSLPAESAQQFPVPKAVLPSCLWSDSKENVTLQIKIAGVQQNILTIDSNQLYYKSQVDRHLYELKIEMYDEIDDFISEIRENCVLVTLKKRKLGKWPRFLKEKTKVFWLGVDYDKLMDSSDEEREDVSTRINWQECRKKPKKEISCVPCLGPDVADQMSNSEESNSGESVDSLSSEMMDHFNLF